MNTEQGSQNTETNVDKAVDFLSDCFCAGIPIREALDRTSEQYGTMAWDTAEAQSKLLSRTLYYANHIATTSIARFSFGRRRSSRFTRLVLDEIDQCGGAHDMSEDFIVYAAEQYMRMSSRVSSTEGRNEKEEEEEEEEEQYRWVILRGIHKKEIQRNDGDIILRIGENFSSIGLRIWEAGVWLSLAILNNDWFRSVLCGKNVLELASGTGVCARALSDAQVQNAYLTDMDDDDILHNLKLNVQNNCRDNSNQNNIHIDVLDIFDAHAVRQRADQWDIDTLVAADITYDEDLNDAVTAAVQRFVSGTKRTAWLVATRRNDVTFARLPERFTKAGLNVKDVTSELRPEKPTFFKHCEWERIHAWQFTDI